MIRQFAPWVLLAIVGGAAIWYVQREQGRRAVEAAAVVAAQQDAEEALLDEQRVTAAARADADRLAKEVEELTAGNATLAAMLERARKATPDARVTSVERTCTGPVEAQADIWKGDKIDLRVSEITTETRAGTVALVGTAEVWRLEPPPEALVARAELHGTYLVEPAPPPPAGWPTWALAAAGILGSAATIAVLRAVR